MGQQGCAEQAASAIQSMWYCKQVHCNAVVKSNYLCETLNTHYSASHYLGFLWPYTGDREHCMEMYMLAALTVLQRVWKRHTTSWQTSTSDRKKLSQHERCCRAQAAFIEARGAGSSCPTCSVAEAGPAGKQPGHRSQASCLE